VKQSSENEGATPAAACGDCATGREWAALGREHAHDRFHDECGVFGVHGHPEASNITYLGLYALQHRGQESAGIVSVEAG